MALSRWRWVWGPVLAAVGLAVLILPGTEGSPAGVLSLFLGSQAWNDAPRTYRADVENAVRYQRARLRVAERADSVLAAARSPRAVRSRDGGLAVIYETPLGVSEARVWLRAAEAELSRYPDPGSLGMPIVVALYSNPARAKSVEYGNYRWPPRQLTPDSGRAACIVEVNLVPPGGRSGEARQRLRAAPEGPFLDLCALYRRFGAPGYAVARWVGFGGMSGVSGGGSWSSALADARRPVPRREISRPSLANFRDWQWYWGTPWISIGCLGGTWSLCERNAGIGGQPGFWRSFEDPSAVQLAGFLLASGTPAQFATFWRSSLPVSEAIHHAYGRPAGQLAYEAFSHWFSAAPSGPRAEPRLLLAGLIWAGAALALALVVGRRWTIEN